jgi:hypothetical protein
MEFSPYNESKEMLCRQERVLDCSYAGMNGQIMQYSLGHPYHMKTFVDPNVLVFDNIDLYPQNICDKRVLSRGGNKTMPRVLEKSCYGQQCFISTPNQNEQLFFNRTKQGNEQQNSFKSCPPPDTTNVFFTYAPGKPLPDPYKIC